MSRPSMYTGKRRRTAKDEPRNASQRVTTGAVIGGFPRLKRVVLAYGDEGVFTGATAAVNEYRLNSLFDPDFTGIGNQPHFFDEWTAIYKRYLVTAVDLTITFSPGWNTSGSDRATGCGYYISNVTGSPPGSGLIENPGLAEELYVPNDKTVVVKRHIKLNEVVGLTMAEYKGANSRMYGKDTTNPQEIIRLWVRAARIGAGTNVECPYKVQMQFHCEFSDMKNVAQS